MYNIMFVEEAVNCTYWCLDTLRIAGITDLELKAKAKSLIQKANKHPNARTTLIDTDWFQEKFNVDMMLLLEYTGTRKNKLTGKTEDRFCFIKKIYGNSTFTYMSNEFSI